MSTAIFLLSIDNQVLLNRKSTAMRKCYIFALFVSIAVQSQDYLWVRTPEITLTMNSDLVGYAMTTDAANNVYTAGFKDHAFAYGDIFGDVFFIKYNNAGAEQFAKTFTGRITVYDIATDPDGNVIMDIGYVNNATIGSLVLSTANQGIQPLLVKFDPSGNLLWSFQPNIPGSIQTLFRAMTVDSSGNIYVGLDNFMDSYIQKFSPDGIPGAVITQNGAQLLNSLDTDTEGNIYAAGSCANPDSSYAGVSAPTNLIYNTWIVKYSPAGVFQWVRYVDDITCSRPQVRANTPDQVYFASDLYGAYAFDSITAEGPVSGMFSDFFVAKLNESGTFQWVKEIIGSGVIEHGYRNYLSTDGFGNVYFAGKTRGTINWENGTTTSPSGFSSDAILLKYNQAGELMLAKTAGGASEDRLDAVSVNFDGTILVSGMARGTATFDAIIHEEESTSVVYPFTGKINNAILGNPQYENISVSIWPNPVNEILNISGLKAPAKAQIINTLGQVVLFFEIFPGQPVDFGNLPKGVYLLKIQGYSSLKFIKS